MQATTHWLWENIELNAYTHNEDWAENDHRDLAQEFLPFCDLMRDLSYQKDATPEVVGRLETITIDPKKLSSGQNATPPQLTKDNDSSKPK
jgi:hypothetical protein